MGQIIIEFSNFICGYPLFFWLIGGGIFLFIYSRAVSLRHFGDSIRALRKNGGNGDGEISSLQALFGAISATVGMGNIAGVAIAIVVGGPGTVFWMWVSAILGMATKFFEGALTIMYKGRTREGELRGGPMYVIMEGLGKKYKPLAVLFSCAASIGCLSMLQANQTVEAVIALTPESWLTGGDFWLRLGLGIAITAIVSVVIIGGIRSITKVASRMVPMMVSLYLILVIAVVVMNLDKVPGVFASIFREAFSLKAGIGGLIGVALTGARRAVYINEAGAGTAMMMHGASRSKDPVHEGFVAMLEPAIDSGLICTLTAIPIIMADCYHVEGVQGLSIAMASYDVLLPHMGKYVLMLLILFFAFSTMFSYSYYGRVCTEFLFGAKATKYYEWFYLLMLLVASVLSVGVAISIEDIAFAFMTLPTIFTIVKLSPKVLAALRKWEAGN